MQQFIVILILAATAVFALRKVVRLFCHKDRGGCGCNCGCQHCHNCPHSCR